MKTQDTFVEITTQELRDEKGFIFLIDGIYKPQSPVKNENEAQENGKRYCRETKLNY